MAIIDSAKSEPEFLPNVRAVTEGFVLRLENQMYRDLPAFLEREHGITITSRLIKRRIGSEEIDFLAEGTREKMPVIVVGLFKAKLTARHFNQLKRKIAAVESHSTNTDGREIVPLLLTHQAATREIERAGSENIIVVQSYEC